MADQREITLRPGDATPKDVVLYELPVATPAATTTIYLVVGDATAKDVVLRDPAVQPGGGGPATITGTLSATDGIDTAAFSGSVIHNITGTLAATDGADTAAFAGYLAHVGTLEATDSADTAAFAGLIAHVGSLVATDAADTASIVGDVIPVAAEEARHGGGWKKYAKRSTMAFVRHKGKILLFTNDEEAQAWLAAQEAINNAKAKKSPSILRIATIPIKPMETIRIADIRAKAITYNQDEQAERLIRRNETEALVKLYLRLKQDEEETALAMLLAA